MKQIIYYLIAGTRGGYVRARIIKCIAKKPCNAHQLSKLLDYDYKTIQHHVGILLKHKILDKSGEYGAVYFISELMEKNMSIFEGIWKKFGSNSGKSI